MHDLESALAAAVGQPLEHNSAVEGLPGKAQAAETTAPMGDIEAPAALSLPQPVQHTGTRWEESMFDMKHECVPDRDVQDACLTVGRQHNIYQL